MQDITLNFDASTVAPQRALDPIPSGWYKAVISDAEMVPSANKPQNQMMSLTLTIIEGVYSGRKLYDRLNLVNDNPTAVEIAYGTLSAIQHAVGVVRCQKAAELANRPMLVKVKLVGAESKTDAGGNVKNYDAKNEVKGYDSVNSDHQLGPTGATAGGVAGAPAGTPPWAAGVPGGGAAVPGAPGGFPGPAVAAPAAPSGPAAPAPGGWQPPAGAAQPWAAPGAAAPAPFAPPAAPAAPAAPVVVQDPINSALGDGWLAHPQSAGWYYRGQEVVSEADLRTRYAAPAAPAAPAFTPPAVPGLPPAAAGATQTPPWAR